MGLFGRSRLPEIRDPILGVLEWNKSHWQGAVSSPGGSGTVLLTVARGAKGSSAEDRATYEALCADYPSLEPKLKGALFKLSQSELAEPLWEDSWPTTERALWGMLEIGCGTLNPES